MCWGGGLKCCDQMLQQSKTSDMLMCNGPDQRVMDSEQSGFSWVESGISWLVWIVQWIGGKMLAKTTFYDALHKLGKEGLVWDRLVIWWIRYIEWRLLKQWSNNILFETGWELKQSVDMHRKVNCSGDCWTQDWKIFFQDTYRNWIKFTLLVRKVTDELTDFVNCSRLERMIWV